MNETDVVIEEQYSLKRNNFFINSVSSKFVVNSVVSMIFLYAGSLIDTVIVGAFLGEAGLSAMSLVSPVYLIYYTVGATIGIGASIAASRILGTGNLTEYKKAFSCASYLLAGSAVLMTLIGYLFLGPISRFLSGGSDANTVALVKQYLMFYIPGGGMTLISYIPLYFLKIEGRPKLSSRLFSLSAVINVILSWLFMSPVCHMGIGGASLATTISMGTVAIIGLILLMRGSNDLGFVRDCMSLSLIKELVTAGIPNGLSNLLESAQILMVNLLLLNTGAAVFLPCYTVLRNIMGVQNAVIVGMSSALLPLIGVFFGERDYENERAVMRLSKKVGMSVMIPLIVIVCLIPGILFRLFGVTDVSIINEGRWALPLACAGLLAGYLNSLYTSYMTAINRELFATVLVFLRTFGLLAVFGIPLAYTVGSKGIWLSFSLAEVGTLLAFSLFRRSTRRKNPKLDKYFLDTSLERDGDISFSVRNAVEDIVAASRSCSDYCEEHDVDMKRCMRVSLAIEELLTFLIGNCFKTDQEKYIDVRVCKLGEEVMLRFRYIGEIFDPVTFYNNNSDNLEMSEDLLGLKMIFKSAALVDFRQTLGANNLLLMF